MSKEEDIQYQIIKYSLFAGAACFIPFPFVDEWLQYWLGKRMHLRIFEAHEQEATKESLYFLSRRHRNFCMGCLISLLIYPFKKLIRTIAIFLSVKAVADESADWIYRGILLDRALHLGWQDNQNSPMLRHIFDELMKEQKNDLIYRVLKNSFGAAKGTIKGLSKGLWRRIRQQDDPGSNEKSIPMIESLRQEIFQNSQTNQQLEVALKQKLILAQLLSPLLELSKE